MLEHCGSRRVYLRAMCELAGLGFITVDRYPKKHFARWTNAGGRLAACVRRC